MPDTSMAHQSSPAPDHIPSKHLSSNSSSASNNTPITATTTTTTSTTKPSSPSSGFSLNNRHNGIGNGNASGNGGNHSNSSSRDSSPHSKSDAADAPDLMSSSSSLRSRAKGKEPADAKRPSTPVARPVTAELHLMQYQQRDQEHASALLKQIDVGHDLIRDKRREIEYYQQLKRDRNRHPWTVFGQGYAGFGNGTTDGNARVLYPCQRKRPGGRKARELRLTRTQLQEQADRVEMLVPIRLDINHNQIQLRDTFTWNMHEQTVPLDLFVEQLVEDFHLPLNPSLLQTVTNSIRDQVTDYHPHVFLVDEPLDPVLPYTAYKNDDMRILIKLNITIGQHTLVDQFEWDINNPMNSPEEFAQLLTREMSLSGEFTTSVAHCIREQCQLFTKALYVTNHPFDGRPIEDEDVRTALLSSPIASVFRPYILAKDFQPVLYEMSENELDRAERSQSRERRRLRRVRTVNRRGGPTIPDLKDMPKTHRTQIVSSILPGAVQKVTDLEKAMAVKQVKDGESDDDDSDSDVEDLPPEKTIPGYSRMTGRQRQAAINAQKANAQARSQTPEVHSVRSDRTERYAERLRHETPLSTPLQQTQTITPSIVQRLPRRQGVPLHQDSAVFKVKLNLAKFRKTMEDLKARDAQKAAQQLEDEKARELLRQQAAAMPPPSQQPSTSQKTPLPSASTPAAASSPPTPAHSAVPAPPLTPPTPTPSAPAAASAPAPAAAQSPTPAAAPAPAPSPASAPTPTPAPSTNPPGSAEEAPPPPDWLITALSRLRETYTNDNFEATMRRIAFDAETGQSMSAAQIQATSKEIKWKWIPRIRCHDCPGKLYTPGPEQTVESFLVHVKNRGHRVRVDQRTKTGGGGAMAGAGSS
ncbi:hypothetical protein BZA05DRAFT_383841 [Tricharina praecox]|uniref:uncharacterized protein n=1 Tax=Tricharina praecox TaxID=43433 RepID=UPI00221F48D3|nr:uncharacterized protein BZA05DRAFT_383841 [Tricharina praecox]KAI5857515.1 hypothetical protein BZA05DRAFT_383841 [Tricharina praecox]